MIVEFKVSIIVEPEDIDGELSAEQHQEFNEIALFFEDCLNQKGLEINEAVWEVDNE